MVKKFLLFLLIFVISVSYSEEYLTLEKLTPLLENSPLAKIYKSQYENSVIKLNLTQASFNPQINSSISYSQGEVKYLNLNKTQQNQDINVSLSFSDVLLLWGKNGIDYQASLIDVEKARNNLKSNLQNLFYQLTQQFYNLYLAQEQLKIVSESYNLALEQSNIAEKKFANGEISQVDLLSAKINLKNAEINLSSAKNNLESAYKSLENLLGTKLDRVPVKLDLNYTPFNENPEDLINILNKNNINILNAELDLKKAELSLSQANLPSWTFSLNGSYNKDKNALSFSFNTQSYALNLNYKYNSSLLSNSTSSSQDSWNIGFSFSIPIFDSGIRNNNIKQAELQVLQAQLTLENIKKEQELNFWQTYYALLQAQENIKQKELTLQQKKQNYEYQKIRYDLGLITELDLKNAELSVLQAQYDLSKAILDFNLYRLKLEQILNR